MEDKNEIQNYNIKTNHKKSSKQFKKNSIPKPLKKVKSNKNEIKKISNRKLNLSRNENYLLKKYANSNTSNSKTDLIKVNINTYNKTSELSEKFKNIVFPVRKLSRARTFFESGDKEENELILKLKRKKLKNLKLLIKLADENEKIENEYYKNGDDAKNFRDKIKFGRNKSEINLYAPCVTYNKNNIYFQKKYDLIKNKFNFSQFNNSNGSKYNKTNSLEKELSSCGLDSNNIITKNKSSNLLQKVLSFKNINLPIRKNKKTKSLYLTNLSPQNNLINNHATSRESSENNLLETYNSSYMNSFNTELQNNIDTTKKNCSNQKVNYKYSFSSSNSVKALTNFSKSKSKSRDKNKRRKLPNKSIFPLVNKIIEESSKIEEGIKTNYKKDNEAEKLMDKKKEINEVKNLTKKRKLNIDQLRKRLNLDEKCFEGNKKNCCFDLYEILNKNINNMKKIVDKNGIKLIKEAANKIIYEDKMLYKDIYYYNNKYLGQFMENKRDKMFNKIFEKQNQIKKEIIGKPKTLKEKMFQFLKDDILE